MSQLTCPCCASSVMLDDGRLITVTNRANSDAQLSAILGRAVAKQAETIAAQADQIVSLSKS